MGFGSSRRTEVLFVCLFRVFKLEYLQWIYSSENKEVFRVNRATVYKSESEKDASQWFSCFVGHLAYSMRKHEFPSTERFSKFIAFKQPLILLPDGSQEAS